MKAGTVCWMQIRIRKTLNEEQVGYWRWGKIFTVKTKSLQKGRKSPMQGKKSNSPKEHRKIIFARALMDITKPHLSQDQEKDISVSENTK